MLEGDLHFSVRVKSLSFLCRFCLLAFVSGSKWPTHEISNLSQLSIFSEFQFQISEGESDWLSWFLLKLKSFLSEGWMCITVTIPSWLQGVGMGCSGSQRHLLYNVSSIFSNHTLLGHFSNMNRQFEGRGGGCVVAVGFRTV